MSLQYQCHLIEALHRLANEARKALFGISSFGVFRGAKYCLLITLLDDLFFSNDQIKSAVDFAAVYCLECHASLAWPSHQVTAL